MKVVRIAFGATLCVALQLGMMYSIDLGLAWIIVSCFFFEENETVLFALTTGFLHDSIVSPFGIHLIIYSTIALVGLTLVRTIITHRSPIAFCALATTLIVLFIVLSVSIINGYEVVTNGRGINASIQQWMIYIFWQIGGIGSGVLMGYLLFDHFLPTRRYYRV